MASNDRLYRFLFEKFGVRGEFVRLGASWAAIQARHVYPEVVAGQLGCGLAAVTLLSGMIKFKGSLIMQLQGDGPLRTLVAQATDQRAVRGMARWSDDLPSKLGADMADLYGDGRLVLTAEAPGGERYQGIVALVGEHLGRALETYFVQSEQIETRIWLAAGDDAAAGLLLQRMPDGDTSAEDWRRVCVLADTLNNADLLGLEVDELLHRLFHEEQLRLFEPEPVAFRCDCSRARIADVLRAMGRDDVEAVLSEQGEVAADCEFCNAHYRFDAVDVGALFSSTVVADKPARAQ